MKQLKTLVQDVLLLRPEKFKMALAFAQILHGFRTAFLVQWPKNADSTFDTFSIAQVNLLSWGRVDCIMETNYYNSFAMYAITPLALMLLLRFFFNGRQRRVLTKLAKFEDEEFGRTCRKVNPCMVVCTATTAEIKDAPTKSTVSGQGSACRYIVPGASHVVLTTTADGKDLLIPEKSAIQPADSTAVQSGAAATAGATANPLSSGAGLMVLADSAGNLTVHSHLDEVDTAREVQQHGKKNLTVVIQPPPGFTAMVFTCELSQATLDEGEHCRGGRLGRCFQACEAADRTCEARPNPRNGPAAGLLAAPGEDDEAPQPDDRRDQG